MLIARDLLKALMLWALLPLPLLAQVVASPSTAPAPDATQAVLAEAPMAEAPLPATTSSQAPPNGGIAAAAESLAPPASDALALADDAALKAYVDGIIASLRHEHRLPALTVSVVRGNALVMAQGYGYADIASARPVVADTTLFRIGSVSKTFIWTAVMMLVERGQLDLDADINTYLKTVRVADAFGTPVTMRQLMHHRAGFEDSMRLFSIADDDPRTLAELLAQQQPARVYAPGLRTSYSNYGAALAAQVVSDVSGQPYGDFLRHEILDPLGLRATTFVAPSKLDAATRANLATGYQDDDGALGLRAYMQIGAYWPAGGIASTSTDMARWMRFHLNGGELDGVRLMSAATHASMWTRGFDDRPGAADLAHGFQDSSYRGLRLLGHGGATNAFYTNMVLVPELGLGVFVSQSSRQTRLSVSQLPTLIIDQIRASAYQPELAVDAGDPGALADVAGSYLHNRRVFSSFAAVFGLDSTAQVTPLSADVLLLHANDQATQYRRVGKERDLFEAADGQRIAFIREGDRVVALADGSGVHTLEKVGVLGQPQTVFGAIGLAIVLSLTTLLGFWWRLGRGSAYGQGVAAGFAACISLLAALCVFGLVGAVVHLVIALSGLDGAAFIGNYPDPTMLHTHYAGWVVAGAAAALWLALLPAWRADGWGLWRRLHYSAYTLVLTLTAYLLWQWKVFGAPVY